MKRIFTTIAVFVITSQTFSQGSAREFLAQSLKAYGAWNNVETLEYEVNGVRNAGAQAKTYNIGDTQNYYSKRTYDFPERQLFEINKNYFPGGYVFNFATIVKDTTAFQYDVTGSRTGKVFQTGGKAASNGRLAVVNNHIAYYKVKELFNTSDSLRLVENPLEEHIIIKRFNKEDTGIGEYYFSPEDHFLRKVISGSQELVFSQYQNHEGRRDNLSVVLNSEGKKVYEDKITVLKTGFTFDPALLELPKDYVKAAPEPVSKPQEIAEDIFLIENLAGDRNVLFVNMDEYIVVLEAPISSDLSKQVINLIKEMLPEKPIKYVFTTHYHNDHTGGLRQYVQEGAELIMANHTKEYVKELIAGEKNSLGAETKEASFLIIEDILVLKDENHIIEFHEVPNSHSDGMALAYFPNEKIIYQGDLLSIPQDGTMTAPIEVTKEMFQFLKNEELEFTRMIGHHGHNFITREMLNSTMEK